ncbi:MAG: twin-arginine translocase TatA/TatE family subunit [Acidimicrobiales bacterium]|jgi:sec-independent protein translocase protein TatA|nr:twin-arginine translocase TatA/TatE family subunit [Acidimicrobiales bacterium]
MFAFLQGNEVIYIVLLAVLVFGGAKIPKLARSLGQAQNEFKAGLNEGADEEDDESTSKKA